MTQMIYAWWWVWRCYGEGNLTQGNTLFAFHHILISSSTMSIFAQHILKSYIEYCDLKLYLNIILSHIISTVGALSRL